MGIISYFNLNYVKTDVFSREISKIISSAYRLREKADTVINSISEYLDKKYTE